MTLAEALIVGQRGVMETLCFPGNVIRSRGARALVAALDSGGAQGLKKLYLTGNIVSGEGIRYLVEAFTRQASNYTVCVSNKCGPQLMVVSTNEGSFIRCLTTPPNHNSSYAILSTMQSY